MRVALVAESFLPHANGVTHSLLRVIEHLTARGDQALVIAPEAKGSAGPVRYGAATVRRLPSMGWPGYDDVRVALSGSARIERMLEDFEPDVVHLASPFMLGWSAIRAAQELDLPTVAIYQTEVPSYAGSYNVAWGEPILWNRVRNIHARAGLTLAPSTYAMRQLEQLGVPRLRLWPRGVDTARFRPDRRDADLRRAWAPRAQVIVGYAGRLAAEKRVGDLARLSEVDGIQVVIIGEGPSRSRLESLMPDAVFTGFLAGDELARAIASLDVFVHCGELETFCQTIQEAHASGVPVVAPRRGGPIDLVDPDHTGYLYPPGRLDAMVAGVRTLVTDPERRAVFSANARVSVEDRTWPRVCDTLIGYYEEAIRDHAATPPLPWGAGVAVAA
ncbi:MAG: glycosyltransferase family 4 protein, partial [Demequina sp.]